MLVRAAQDCGPQLPQLRVQHPDYHYLKKVFQHTRELLDIGPAPQTKRLPELLTEAELVAFYDAVWHARQLAHGAMLKLLLFTGMRNAELVHLRPTDVDLQTCQVRIGDITIQTELDQIWSKQMAQRDSQHTGRGQE